MVMWYYNYNASLTMEGSIMDFMEFLSDFRDLVLPVGLPEATEAVGLFFLPMTGVADAYIQT